ncbi:MAG: hypothetical protein KAJ19_10105 [Gammaproteobacteria bacterium]|nr:hypothetical protein [Gammaproteobacteria bacterium]
MIDKEPGIRSSQDGKTKYHGKKGQTNTTGPDYRLIHNGVKVIGLIDGKTAPVTTSPDWLQVEEFPTKESALNAIDRLGLEYETDQQEA